jgi:hypothetical protein
MLENVLIEIRQRTCPKCRVKGSLDIQMNHAMVVCRNCHRSHIDPFEIGPWEEQPMLLDTRDGETVSFYVPPLKSPESPKDIVEPKAEFYKYVFEGMRDRVIEGG